MSSGPKLTRELPSLPPAPSALTYRTEREGRPVFSMPLSEAITYASITISTPGTDGQFYVWGVVPTVVARWCVPPLPAPALPRTLSALPLGEIRPPFMRSRLAPKLTSHVPSVFQWSVSEGERDRGRGHVPGVGQLKADEGHPGNLRLTTKGQSLAVLPDWLKL